MVRAKLIGAGMRVAAVILVGLSLAATSLVYGNGITKEERLDSMLRNGAVVMELNGGCLDKLWGLWPEGFKDARYITDISTNLAGYIIDFDVSPIFGKVFTYSGQRLIFTKEQGLVQVGVDFDAREYDVVQERLTRLLGEPNPIVYERMPASKNFSWRSEWRVGRNTKVILISRALDATIEISKRDFFLPPEGDGFSEVFAAAMLKQAEEYDKQNQILEASSVYQMLLNSMGSYRSFMPTAQERLANYSRQKDAVEYMGHDGGFVFSRLKNSFPDSTGQLWVCADLSLTAQEELEQQRPSDIEPTIDISAVLYRVRLMPAINKYSVVEQIWLDGSGRIIGGRPVWAPQDTGWLAPYITQKCELFLKNWFTVGNAAVQVHKE